MISKDILNKEILELESHDTTYATCERLAWLYIVRDHLTGQEQKQPIPLSISGDSEFLKAVNGKDSHKAWAIMDELMDTLKIINNRAYESVLNKIRYIV